MCTSLRCTTWNGFLLSVLSSPDATVTLASLSVLFVSTSSRSSCVSSGNVILYGSAGTRSHNPNSALHSNVAVRPEVEICRSPCAMMGPCEPTSPSHMSGSASFRTLQSWTTALTKLASPRCASRLNGTSSARQDAHVFWACASRAADMISSVITCVDGEPATARESTDRTLWGWDARLSCGIQAREKSNDSSMVRDLLLLVGVLIPVE